MTSAATAIILRRRFLSQLFFEVSRVLVARGTVRSAPALADDIDELTRSMRDEDLGRDEDGKEEN